MGRWFTPTGKLPNKRGDRKGGGATAADVAEATVVNVIVEVKRTKEEKQDPAAFLRQP
jgi:hypothetical protein